MLALISIYILGGEILRGFSFAMILVLIGTYSSIFVITILKFFKVDYKTLEKDEENTSINKDFEPLPLKATLEKIIKYSFVKITLPF